MLSVNHLIFLQLVLCSYLTHTHTKTKYESVSKQSLELMIQWNLLSGGLKFITHREERKSSGILVVSKIQLVHKNTKFPTPYLLFVFKVKQSLSLYQKVKRESSPDFFTCNSNLLPSSQAKPTPLILPHNLVNTNPYFISHTYPISLHSAQRIGSFSTGEKKLTSTTFDLCKILFPF